MRNDSVALAGHRYLVQNKLGQGGMGVVFRALDRLHGREVALKRVAIADPAASEGENSAPSVASVGNGATVGEIGEIVLSTAALGRTRAAFALTDAAPFQRGIEKASALRSTAYPLVGEELRLALAQEFHTLSSLRHPHIISVLDYGFDQNRDPFFTMELLKQAKPLTHAAVNLPMAARVELLQQVLQALIYLHRRGVLHRDLKPANILVVSELGILSAKLLDFGLAVLNHQLRDRAGDISGTVGYIAPEVLRGTSPTERSDLYAFGIISYELLVGHPPIACERESGIIPTALAEDIDWSATGLSPALVEFLHRLLARSPDARYQNAESTARALAAATGGLLPVETEGVRESFLQAAEMVGRDVEMAQLRGALVDALVGQGSAWIIGGESGVGKSRLCDELRTQGQVRGARVLRGQAVSHGGTGGSLFTQALRALSLEVELNELEASVLKTLVADLPFLLGREIADPPELTAQATRLRLLRVAENVLLRSEAPMVLLLEDLHWAEPDSMDLLRRITERAKQRSLLVLCTYRDDERAELPTELPDAKVLKLPRLSADAVASLGESMLGVTGKKSDLVELLLRESEGNTFFILEVMRALAEESGGLSEVARRSLPKQVFAGGVQAALQRRLGRVPASMQPLLQIAAVVGRQIDLKVLRAADSLMDLESWLRRCSDVAVLELSEQQWRFSHEKLRERLLTDLTVDQRRQLHNRVAEAIVHAYADLAPHAATLAYHYEQAGNVQEAGRYAAWAGELAVQRGALADARNLLTKAITLSERTSAPSLVRARLYRLLMSALFGLGELTECEVLLRKALEQLKNPLPADRWHMILAIFRQVGWQSLHRLHPVFVRNAKTETEVAIIEELIIIYELMGEYYAWQNRPIEGTYSFLLAANTTERHGNPSKKAIGFSFIGYLFTLSPLKLGTRLYNAQSRKIFDQKSDSATKLLYLRAITMAHLNTGELADSKHVADQALKIAQEVGDLYAQMHLLVIKWAGNRLSGDLSEARETAGQLLALAKSTENRLFQTWGNGMLGSDLLKLGKVAEAHNHLEIAATLADKGGFREVGVYYRGLQALCAVCLGEQKVASTIGDIMLAQTEGVLFTHNGCYEGYPALVEAFMLLWERCRVEDERRLIEGRLLRALRVLRLYSIIFPNGKPAYYLLRGRHRWGGGMYNDARKDFLQSSSCANRLGMKYEFELAQAWILRTDDRCENRNRILASAGKLREMGADWVASQIEQWDEVTQATFLPRS